MEETARPFSNSAFSHGITLTAREIEVLRLMGLDKGTEQIAVELDLSYHTVRNYIRNAREKLGANTKLSAVLIAQNRGLI